MEVAQETEEDKKTKAELVADRSTNEVQLALAAFDTLKSCAGPKRAHVRVMIESSSIRQRSARILIR